MRRSGRLGDYLATDDYSGRTEYASKLKQDYWGSYAKTPLKRNLQEIAKGMNDPQIPDMVRAASYEVVTTASLGVPLKIGNTNVDRQFNDLGAIVMRQIYGTK